MPRGCSNFLNGGRGTVKYLKTMEGFLRRQFRIQGGRGGGCRHSAFGEDGNKKEKK